MIRKLLVLLHILQETTIEGKDKRGFKYSYNLRRFNLYNPLSYITIVIIFIVDAIMFGFVGIWKKLNTLNPFKWQ